MKPRAILCSSALALACAACGDDGSATETDSSSGSPTTGTATPTTGETTGAQTSAATTDASASSSDETGQGETSTGNTPGEGVPMFVALGQGGRRLVSCDDGATWGAEMVVEANDDDHGPYSSRDVASGDGIFLLGMGWGNPARIARSDNGIDWTETFPPPDYVEMRGLSGIAFGDGRFVAVVGADSWTSEDGGTSWTLAGQLPTGDNIRVVTHAAGGPFFAAADGGLLYSSTDGSAWSGPLATAGSCDGGNLSRRGGLADRDGVTVLVSDIGNVCRTDDGGRTFTHHTIGSGGGDVLVRADVVVTANGFYAGSRDGGWHSPDGIEWTFSGFALEGADISTLAADPQSTTVVGIAQNGDDFYRSTDGGISWSRATAPAGNDVTRAAFGYASPSSDCPG